MVLVKRPEGIDQNKFADTLEELLEDNGYEVKTRHKYRNVYTVGPSKINEQQVPAEIFAGEEMSRKIVAKKQYGRWTGRKIDTHAKFGANDDNLSISVSDYCTETYYGTVLLSGAALGIGIGIGMHMSNSPHYGWMGLWSAFVPLFLGFYIRLCVGAELYDKDPFVKGLVKRFTEKLNIK